MPNKNIFCVNCESLTSNIIKYGKDSNNQQRYLCKECKRTFINDTTPFKNLKISEYTFKKFIGFMIDDTTMEVISRNLKLDIKSIHYYRFIVFKAIEDIQDSIKLNGSVIIDETFIPIRELKYRIKKHDNKETRGLSFNQLCIVTMIDLTGKSVAKATNRAMALPNHYVDNFTNNIGFVREFIHDGNLRSTQFMNQFKVDKINGRKDTTGNYSVDLIDHYHSNLKRYLFKHVGYKLKNVQYYLNFFVYRQNYLKSHEIRNMRDQNKVKNCMIEDLLKIIKKSTKKINYQEYLKDKGIEKILDIS